MKHQKAAKIALMREFAQVEDMNMYKSIDTKTLTKEQTFERALGNQR